MPSRVLAGVLAAAIVASAAAAAPQRPRQPAPALPATIFVFNGHGWGHGIGLAQYGALGFAREGVRYERILAHYYPGTRLGKAPLRKIRVLLRQSGGSIRVSSTASFRVRDAKGKTRALAPGTATVAAAGAGAALKTSARTLDLPAPVTFLPGSAPLELDRPYRGTLEISASGGKVRAINVVGLDAYLYGVITSEMPHDWPLEALKAQAVAARSYALSTRRGGDVDVYPDVRSQVYGGIEAEDPNAQRAVDATAGQVLFYGGKVAHTYFFASSGGRTAAVTDVWPDANPLPYLVSVPDPHDVISPYHDWGPVVLTPAAIGRALGAPPTLDLLPQLSRYGRVREITVRSARGDVTMTGSEFRRALGLRSTWVRIGVLALDRPPHFVVYGSQARLTGLARAVRASIEQRPLGSMWQRRAALVPEADGRFEVTPAPRVTTDYRLRTGDVVGPAVRVSVAASVKLAAVYRLALRGRVAPVSAVPVTVERAEAARWRLVTTVTPDARGRFAVAALEPGRYRARYEPAVGGVGSGVSATVVLE